MCICRHFYVTVEAFDLVAYEYVLRFIWAPQQLDCPDSLSLSLSLSAFRLNITTI